MSLNDRASSWEGGTSNASEWGFFELNTDAAVGDELVRGFWPFGGYYSEP